MKNANWRKAAIIMGLIIAGMVAFGAGYIIGEIDATKRLITIGVEVLGIEDIGIADLYHQYRRLKGGA